MDTIVAGESALDMSLMATESLPDTFVGGSLQQSGAAGTFGIGAKNLLGMDKSISHQQQPYGVTQETQIGPHPDSLITDPNDYFILNVQSNGNQQIQPVGTLNLQPNGNQQLQPIGSNGLSQSFQNFSSLHGGLFNPFAHLFNPSGGRDLAIPSIGSFVSQGMPQPAAYNSQFYQHRTADNQQFFDDFGGFGRRLDMSANVQGGSNNPPFIWDGIRGDHSLSTSDWNHFQSTLMNVNGQIPFLMPPHPPPQHDEMSQSQPPVLYPNYTYNVGLPGVTGDARVQQETGTQTQGDMSTVLLPFNRCYAPYKVANQMIHLENPQPPGNNFSGPIPIAHQQNSRSSEVRLGGQRQGSRAHSSRNVSAIATSADGSAVAPETVTGGSELVAPAPKRYRAGLDEQLDMLMQKMGKFAETGVVAKPTISQRDKQKLMKTAVMSNMESTVTGGRRKRNRPQQMQPCKPSEKELISEAVMYRKKAYYALPVELEVQNKAGLQQPVFDFVGKQWDARTYQQRVKKNLLKTKISARSLKTLLENQDLVDRGAADPLAKRNEPVVGGPLAKPTVMEDGTEALKKFLGKKLPRSRIVPSRLISNRSESADANRSLSTEYSNQSMASDASSGDGLEILHQAANESQVTRLDQTCTSTDSSVIEVPMMVKKGVRRNPRPKHLSFDLLQIGQFLAARNLATKTPNHNKLKIHFGLENIVYELRVDRKGVETLLNLQPSDQPDAGPMMISIVVPFLTVVGLDIRQQEVILEVSKMPEMLIGFNRNTMFKCSRFENNGKTLDITGGNLGRVRFHRLVLTAREGGVCFGQSLCKFHDHFKRIQKHISVYDEFRIIHRGAEPSSPPELGRSATSQFFNDRQITPPALLMSNERMEQSREQSNFIAAGESNSFPLVTTTAENHSDTLNTSDVSEEGSNQEVVAQLTPLGTVAADFQATYYNSSCHSQTSTSTGSGRRNFVSGTNCPLLRSALEMGPSGSH